MPAGSQRQDPRRARGPVIRHRRQEKARLVLQLMGTYLGWPQARHFLLLVENAETAPWRGWRRDVPTHCVIGPGGDRKTSTGASRFSRFRTHTPSFSTPYLAASYEAWRLTPGILRLDPMFDPIRNDSRFQKLGASPFRTMRSNDGATRKSKDFAAAIRRRPGNGRGRVAT